MSLSTRGSGSLKYFETQIKDINECVLGTHTCATDGYCVNTKGAFGCKCKDGYDGDGFTCENIDECTAPIDGVFKCDVNAECTDLTPGFRCDCNTGYDGRGFSGECRDLDECFLNTHSCDDESQNCRNTEASYICLCNAGFKAEGDQCVNINECSDFTHKCDPNAFCTDLTPRYRCTCKEGYEGKEFVISALICSRNPYSRRWILLYYH